MYDTNVIKNIYFFVVSFKTDRDLFYVWYVWFVWMLVHGGFNYRMICENYYYGAIP